MERTFIIHLRLFVFVFTSQFFSRLRSPSGWMGKQDDNGKFFMNNYVGAGSIGILIDVKNRKRDFEQKVIETIELWSLEGTVKSRMAWWKFSTRFSNLRSIYISQSKTSDLERSLIWSDAPLHPPSTHASHVDEDNLPRYKSTDIKCLSYVCMRRSRSEGEE